MPRINKRLSELARRLRLESPNLQLDWDDFDCIPVIVVDDATEDAWEWVMPIKTGSLTASQTRTDLHTLEVGYEYDIIGLAINDGNGVATDTVRAYLMIGNSMLPLLNPANVAAGMLIGGTYVLSWPTMISSVQNYIPASTFKMRVAENLSALNISFAIEWTMSATVQTRNPSTQLFARRRKLYAFAD